MPGFQIGKHEDKLGIRGSPTTEVICNDVRVPAANRLGGEGGGFKLALRALDHSRVTIGAQAVGIAQGALDYALGYTKERQQFGSRIADFQGIQFMLADMAMHVEAARGLVYAAAAKADRGDPDLTFSSAAAKCFASDTAMRVTTDAVQLLGGYVVFVHAAVNDVGRTSMEVGVRVEAEEVVSGRRTHTSSAYLVFVALDEHGHPRPVPPIEPETEVERRRQAEASIRRESRLAREEAIRRRRATT